MDEDNNTVSNGDDHVVEGKQTAQVSTAPYMGEMNNRNESSPQRKEIVNNTPYCQLE